MAKYSKKRIKINRIIFACICLVGIFFLGFFVGCKVLYKDGSGVSAENNKISTKKIAEKKNSKVKKVDVKKKEENIEEKKEENKEEKKEKKPFESPYKEDGKKVAYLTFDDGPSANLTPEILDILKEYDIKATFFVIGSLAEENSDLVKREIKEGHSIGNHTYSHNLRHIYLDPNTFIQDIQKGDNAIKDILGDEYEDRKLIRFPGGSFGERLAPFREKVEQEGYHYVDWNDMTGDAEGHNIAPDILVSNLKKYTEGHEDVVVLMHDAPAKRTTVQALPQVIEYLKSQGFEFKAL